MGLRRALITAPLAILVAIAAHAIGFGGDHALGGAYAGLALAAGFGGTLLLGGLALVWLTLDHLRAPIGERALLGALPGRGDFLRGAAVLAGSGYLAFAAGEALEGRSPLGTVAAWLVLGLVSVVVVCASRAVVRWLAAGAEALATLLGWAAQSRFGNPLALAPVARPIAIGRLAQGRHDGRAPPPSA